MRPIGAPDGQPVVPQALPQFYWLWTPLNFPNLALYFHVNEDKAGGRWNTRAMLAMDGAGADDLVHLNNPEMISEFHPGTRRVKSSVLSLTDGHGRAHKVHYEPFAIFQMKGIGYGHPIWTHGAWKGDYAIEREEFKPADLPWNQPENLHIQAISRVRHEGPDGQTSEGIGSLEQLFTLPRSRGRCPKGGGGFAADCLRRREQTHHPQSDRPAHRSKLLSTSPRGAGSCSKGLGGDV